MLSAQTLMAHWEPGSGLPAHRRLAPLVAASWPGESVERDTLGARNRRLLALHAALGGGPLDARIKCGGCGTDNEFVVPAADILACPAPDPGARISLRAGGRRLTFRLPTMADLGVCAGADRDAVLAAILARCRVGGSPSEPLPPALADRLAARFETLDPAARIEVDLICVECAGALRAAVEIAAFVAAALDRRVEGLFREVHLLASAYGWSESECLALPEARRRRYLAMIAAGRAEGLAPATRVKRA